MEVAVYLVENWEVVTLLVTNLVALFVKSPLHKKEDTL